jgi:cell volume regulation protein A
LKGALPILLGRLLRDAHVARAVRFRGNRRGRVVFSVLVQGSLTPAVARRLRLPMNAVQPEPWAFGVRVRDEPEGVHRFTIDAESPADQRRIDGLDELDADAWISVIVRDGQLVRGTGDNELRAGDGVTVLAEPGLAEDLIVLLRRQ